MMQISGVSEQTTPQVYEVLGAQRVCNFSALEECYPDDDDDDDDDDADADGDDDDDDDDDDGDADDDDDGDDDDDEEVFVGNPLINYHFGLPKLLQQHVEGFIYLFSDFLTWREGLLRDVFRL